MKHYVKLAIDSATNETVHAATSDGPHKVNPFEGMEDVYFEDYEFDNTEDNGFIKARAFLENVDSMERVPKSLPDKRFSGLKKVTK